MKVLWDLNDVSKVQNASLAIGNFDGVHLGHRALIEKVKTLTKPFGVLSFTPPPATLLSKEKPHFYLTSDEQKITVLSRLGLDFLILLRIDADFLQLSATDFIQKILVNTLMVKHVVVGDDFSFGHKALGNSDLLAKLSLAYGFTTHIVSECSFLERRVSSSAIRDFLCKGEVSRAREMLLRAYSLQGIVMPGKKLGRKLGFPTANIAPDEGFSLKPGIYATITKILSSKEELLSVTSVGFRPTVSDDGKLLVETHCLNKNPDLYGQEIEIFFIEHLRNELKFSSLSTLKLQMQKDCQQVRQSYLHNPSLYQIED